MSPARHCFPSRSRGRRPCARRVPLHSLLGALLLGLAACGDGSLGHAEDRPVQREIALPSDLRLLKVRIPLGSVTVEAGDAQVLALDGVVRKAADDAAGFARLAELAWEPELRATEVAGEFEYRMPGVPDDLAPRAHAVILRASLRLPATIAVDIETGRGHLAVVGRRAAVRLWTASGDVQVRDVVGDAKTFTGLGHCAIIDHRGGLDVESGSGTILAYVDEIGAAGVRLSTLDPSITLHLPDAGFELDAQVERCERDHDLINSFGVPVVAAGSGLRAVGTVRGGGPRVELRVQRGHISIPQRRSAPRDPGATSGAAQAR